MGHCKTWWASSLSLLHPFSPHRAVVCGSLGPWAEERKTVKGSGNFLLGCCSCKVGTSCSLWLRHSCWIFVDGRVLWEPSSLENVFQGFHEVGPLEACCHLTDGSILRQQILFHEGLCQDNLQLAPIGGIHRWLMGNTWASFLFPPDARGMGSFHPSPLFPLPPWASSIAFVAWRQGTLLQEVAN